MTTVLLIGTGPLFAPDVRVFNGQALRTWHFAKPLLAAGHLVDLVVLPVEGQPPPEPGGDILLEREHAGTQYLLVNRTDANDILQTLQQIHDASPYEAIVAVNHNAAVHACRLATRLPLWADLNGYMMGEAQTKGLVYNSDEYLLHFWQRMRIILRRADRFSTVSHKQMYATVGELAAVGRLNRHTASHNFVSTIPNAASEDFLALAPPANTPHSERRFRGRLFPADAFAVLWSGGFNTWTDTRTLAAALSLAMEQEPRIHFVATGGAIPGHDEITYESFVHEMQKTGFLDRCHMLGWVEARDLPALYSECDLGINIDGRNYETLLGARNRLTNMMAIGLPVLTTFGTEISEIIEEHKLGYVVRIGQVEELVGALVKACRSVTDRRLFAARARKFCAEHFSYDATTRPLQHWLASPTLAPDNAEKARLFPQEKHLDRISLNPLEEEQRVASEFDLPRLVEAQRDLNLLRQKRLYRLYKKIFGRS
ncbi:MAG: glycosyltransferase [Candidatus Sumerlaeaceae bacterium]|nr:glycosyltransferase [Candidatus Sumerlaeaceae bacterium]